MLEGTGIETSTLSFLIRYCVRVLMAVCIAFEIIAITETRSTLTHAYAASNFRQTDTQSHDIVTARQEEGRCVRVSQPRRRRQLASCTAAPEATPVTATSLP